MRPCLDDRVSHCLNRWRKYHTLRTYVLQSSPARIVRERPLFQVILRTLCMLRRERLCTQGKPPYSQAASCTYFVHFVFDLRHSWQEIGARFDACMAGGVVIQQTSAEDGGYKEVARRDRRLRNTLPVVRIGARGLPRSGLSVRFGRRPFSPLLSAVGWRLSGMVDCAAATMDPSSMPRSRRDNHGPPRPQVPLTPHLQWLATRLRGLPPHSILALTSTKLAQDHQVAKLRINVCKGHYTRHASGI